MYLGRKREHDVQGPWTRVGEALVPPAARFVDGDEFCEALLDGHHEGEHPAGDAAQGVVGMGAAIGRVPFCPRQLLLELALA